MRDVYSRCEFCECCTAWPDIEMGMEGEEKRSIYLNVYIGHLQLHILFFEISRDSQTCFLQLNYEI